MLHLCITKLLVGHTLTVGEVAGTRKGGGIPTSGKIAKAWRHGYVFVEEAEQNGQSSEYEGDDGDGNNINKGTNT